MPWNWTANYQSQTNIEGYLLNFFNRIAENSFCNFFVIWSWEFGFESQIVSDSVNFAQYFRWILFDNRWFVSRKCSKKRKRKARQMTGPVFMSVCVSVYVGVWGLVCRTAEHYYTLHWWTIKTMRCSISANTYPSFVCKENGTHEFNDIDYDVGHSIENSIWFCLSVRFFI